MPFAASGRAPPPYALRPPGLRLRVLGRPPSTLTSGGGLHRTSALIRPRMSRPLRPLFQAHRAWSAGSEGWGRAAGCPALCQPPSCCASQPPCALLCQPSTTGALPPTLCLVLYALLSVCVSSHSLRSARSTLVILMMSVRACLSESGSLFPIRVYCLPLRRDYMPSKQCFFLKSDLLLFLL